MAHHQVAFPHIGVGPWRSCPKGHALHNLAHACGGLCGCGSSHAVFSTWESALPCANLHLNTVAAPLIPRVARCTTPKTLVFLWLAPHHATGLAVQFPLKGDTTTSSTTTQPSANVNVGIRINVSTCQRPEPRRNLSLPNQVEHCVREHLGEPREVVQDRELVSSLFMVIDKEEPLKALTKIQPIPCFLQLLRVRLLASGACG